MPDDLSQDVEAVQRLPAVPAILDIVCRMTGMGFAAVARVTEDRWIAAQVLDHVEFGMKPGGELEVETTLCHEVRRSEEVIVIEHVAEDAAYSNHHTPRMYGLQSYISVPIRLSDGRFFGTLCAIDAKPAKLNTPEVIGTFKLFAQLIAAQLEAEQKLQTANDSLTSEREGSELREHFVAVLGHDLRNPLASVDAGISRLQRHGWNDQAPQMLQLMRASVRRMSGLIDNVMDLARARLGSGISLRLSEQDSLEATLVQVVEEIRSVHPDRTIETTFRFDRTVAVDHARIAQMFSNLLGNAITHGAPSEPVRVYGSTNDNLFELGVSNGGEAIGAEMMEKLFLPFHRGGSGSGAQGLGLGLYIASEIAKAHGGKIDVLSDTSETRFTFRMPVVVAQSASPSA
ncbi:MAG TPA: GAF domain-containing sensor histidine kinase [Mesorhizobium sp.]|jgi:signal transduction histidine kinase|nr:GAF domain-containing sensor histidine kinase [Mesorhizobium sp.]